MKNLVYSNTSKYVGTFKKNTTYGSWSVLDSRVLTDEKSRAYVLCKCNLCEEESTVICHHLLNGRTTRCARCNYRTSNRSGIKNPNYTPNYIPLSIKKACYGYAHRNISDDEALHILENQHHTCAVTGTFITVTSHKYDLHHANARLVMYNGNFIWVKKGVDTLLQYPSSTIAAVAHFLQKHPRT